MTYQAKFPSARFAPRIANPLARERSAAAIPSQTRSTASLSFGRPHAGAILLGPAIILIVWQFASSIGWLSPRQLAAPSAALATGIKMAVSGDLGAHFFASAERAYAALAIGVIVGLVLALAAGLTRIGEATIDGSIQVKRAIPTLALIPFGILWLGIGDTMKIAIIAISVIIPVYINTHAALRGIDLRYVELARTLGLTRLEFVRKVALPGALPGFFTGLRLAVTACWTSLVVLEQINTTNGIGYLMNHARDYGQTDIIVVCLAIYASLGLGSDCAVRWIERKVLRYRKVLGS